MNEELLYAVGDSHGMDIALEKLMHKIHEDRAGKPATIVFLGDYVDRGPNSDKVVQHLLDLKNRKTTPEVTYIFLRGNHDQMLMDGIRHPMSTDSSLWLHNGGTQTWLSYDDSEYKIEDHIRDFFVHTKFYYKHREFVFVHANLNPFQELANQTENELLWSRDYNNYNGAFRDNVFVIHGHTPCSEPEFKANQLNIDTGCCFTERYPDEFKLGLTAVRINSRKDFKFFHAKQVD